MHVLDRHEIFEMEALEHLKSARLLEALVFGGGTMLRLCHALPRHSVDLDFFFFKKIAPKVFYKKLLESLKTKYEITDSKHKYFTLLVELKSKISERKLKIEVRKEWVRSGTEDQIAYSEYAPKQVLLKTLSLEETARRKIEAIKNRREIRDYFDLEFVLSKGVRVTIEPADKTKILAGIRRFKKTDFLVTLGSLLEKDLRQFYSANGFKRLEAFLK